MAVTPQQMRFGFEYETLIEVKNRLFDPLYQKLKVARKDVNTSCPLEFSNDNTLTRFLLASIFNVMSDKYQFKAAQQYHGEACVTFPLFGTRQARDMMEIDAVPAWVISFDSSVQAQKEGSMVPLYTSFKSLYSGAPPPQPTERILEHMEMVSPILTWADVVEQGMLQQFLDVIIRANDSFVYWNNETTSNHVHVSCLDLFKEPRNLVRAAMAWWMFEPIFLLLVGYWRRGNKYCQPMHLTMLSRYGEANASQLFFRLNETTYPEFFRAVGLPNNIESMITLLQGSDLSARYVAFNMLNVLKLGTVEVRLKQGSTDSEENVRFIQLLGHFFANVLNKPCVNLGYSQDILQLSWTLWRSLMFQLGRPQFVITPDILGHVRTLFDIMVRDFVDDAEVATYWKNVIETINVSAAQGGGGKKAKAYLFSYGSNHVEQLGRRVGRASSAFVMSPAYLENYARIFAGNSRHWGGGVASVHPAKGKRVYGTVVEISTTELERLDAFEVGYTRQRMEVFCQDSQTVCKAYVYVRNDPLFIHPPSESYLQAIRKQLNDTARYHRSKIMIRGVNARGTLITLGYWDPKEGMVLKKQQNKKKA